MSKATDLEAKIDSLQTSLDNEQDQIRTAIEELGALRIEVQTLRDQLAQHGADNEALDRIGAKIDTIKSDLEGTIVDSNEGADTEAEV